MTFAELIKNRRLSGGFTLAKAAKQIGISIGYLNDLEQGRALRPKMKYIYAMAGLYGIDTDVLCVTAERVPQDVFYKIIKNPELIDLIRAWKE
jgi:transcriptional regulator with XRE-family HTH domain